MWQEKFIFSEEFNEFKRFKKIFTVYLKVIENLCDLEKIFSECLLRSTTFMYIFSLFRQLYCETKIIEKKHFFVPC